MNEMQRRAAEWRMSRFPNSDQYRIVAKLTEEIGEVARAVIGDGENRPGRGDAVTEAAQAIIVLVSLVGIHYPDRDVFAEMAAEMDRLEAMPAPPASHGPAGVLVIPDELFTAATVAVDELIALLAENVGTPDIPVVVRGDANDRSTWRTLDGVPWINPGLI